MSRRLWFALGVTVGAAVGMADRALADCPPDPCRDRHPAAEVVRVNLRCDLGARGIDVEPWQRLDVIIRRADAPPRWRPAWGGDGSLAWAQRTLEWMGCSPIRWHDGRWVAGIDCDT